jgi:Rad3-related DNA helicase
LDVSSKALRPYQAKLVTDVCRASGDVLVEQPTGSGKTMQIVTLIGMDLGRRFTHAVISAPQEHIEHGFVHRDYQRVDWSRHGGVAVPSVAADIQSADPVAEELSFQLNDELSTRS